MLSRINKVFFHVTLFAILTAGIPVFIYGQGFDFRGQISTWGTGMKSSVQWNNNFGARYIPQFNYSYNFDDHKTLNAELLVNAWYGTDFKTDDFTAKLYRAILRYSTEQSETQIGLQKINFGPAQLLRTLMWFDKVDPRDPLKLTDGVYGLRYKYNFMDNSNIWLWGLYGNKETKGYEVNGSVKNIPEFGGRIQTPVLIGEMAATFHTRMADAGTFEYRENRYAIDGRWDIGIGIWFESAVQQSRSTLLPYEWNKMITIGADYTIPAGNGIYILGETLSSSASDNILTNNMDQEVSALMLTYQIGVLDNIIVQEYLTWQGKDLYQYYNWQRTYDNIIISAALFHFPESGKGFLPSNQSLPAAGYGAQLMLIYNY
jgi:hypothetical protein